MRPPGGAFKNPDSGGAFPRGKGVTGKRDRLLFHGASCLSGPVKGDSPCTLRSFCERKASLSLKKGKRKSRLRLRGGPLGKPRRSFVGKRNRRALALEGIPVISGMASGIDGAAQEAALLAGGASYAVLGCGPDLCYPRHNRGLYQMLETGGGLISEYPPGTPPIAWHFPCRNRIISGLSDAVLVVEAV